jgi:hypothetical protein
MAIGMSDQRLMLSSARAIAASVASFQSPHIGVGDPCLGPNGGGLNGEQRRARERKMTEVDDVPMKSSLLVRIPAGIAAGLMQSSLSSS